MRKRGLTKSQQLNVKRRKYPTGKHSNYYISGKSTLYTLCHTASIRYYFFFSVCCKNNKRRRKSCQHFEWIHAGENVWNQTKWDKKSGIVWVFCVTWGEWAHNWDCPGEEQSVGGAVSPVTDTSKGLGNRKCEIWRDLHLILECLTALMDFPSFNKTNFVSRSKMLKSWSSDITKRLGKSSEPSVRTSTKLSELP